MPVLYIGPLKVLKSSNNKFSCTSIRNNGKKQVSNNKHIDDLLSAIIPFWYFVVTPLLSVLPRM